MKTLVCIQPKEFAYREADVPLARPGHAVIKVKRIGICGTDLHAFEGTQPFFDYPRILGHELAGDIVDLDRAPGFQPGEAVTIIPYYADGTCIACRAGKPNCCAALRVAGVHVDGGMVEYLTVPSTALVHGRGLSYDQLALIEPLAIGAHAIRRAAVQPGEFVLVVGAGPIGLGCLEAVRIAGGEAIAMDINPERLRFCRDNLKVLHTVDAGGVAAAGAGSAAGAGGVAGAGSAAGAGGAAGAGVDAIAGAAGGSCGAAGAGSAAGAGGAAGAGVDVAADAVAQLQHITRGDMPAVVIDATGSRNAINDGFRYMAHGGRYVLVGLQKGAVQFSHPEFHKREGTLVSSRNATCQDFEQVIDAMQKRLIDPTTYITHRVRFDQVKDQFASWLDPASGVIKAMVEV